MQPVGREPGGPRRRAGLAVASLLRHGLRGTAPGCRPQLPRQAAGAGRTLSSTWTDIRAASVIQQTHSALIATGQRGCCNAAFKTCRCDCSADCSAKCVFARASRAADVVGAVVGHLLARCNMATLPGSAPPPHSPVDPTCVRGRCSLLQIPQIKNDAAENRPPGHSGAQQEGQQGGVQRTDARAAP
jgi:hypothetical protein